MAKDFPSSFLWGAATSAHQVEGGNHNDWSEWEKLGLVKNKEQSGRATDHYHRFKEDFALAKSLGHNAHRLSIEWSRIEPQPRVFDMAAIEHYREVLTELRRLGIEPIVTLHHFTNPIWVADYGAWLKRRSIDDFGRYVQVIVGQLGSLVKYWVTINEPTVNTALGYLSDWWPPQRRNVIDAWTAIHHLAKAHRLAYQIIHRHSASAKVGVANNLSNFVPARKNNLFDHGIAGLAHYWHNRWWLDETHDTQDFFGLNYYFHNPVRAKVTLDLVKLIKPEPVPGTPRSDLDWEIHPEGMATILRWLAKYRRPIIITENGLADATDKLRSQFIRDYIHVVAEAIKDGIDIRGYLHWSLLDNFEWREGFGPRFGLVAIDYQTMARMIRPSAYEYKKIIEAA